MATADKASVVVEPSNPLYRLLVGDEFEILRARRCVEFVDPDFLLLLACKEVATVGEDNLTTLLDLKLLVRDELLVQDVHKSDRIAEANDQVEARRVEGDRVGLLLGWVAKFRLEHLTGRVGPKSDCTIRRACCNELFLDTHIKAVDLLGVEG